MIYLLIESWALCFAVALFGARCLELKGYTEPTTRLEAALMFALAPLAVALIYYDLFKESDWWSKPL